VKSISRIGLVVSVCFAFACGGGGGAKTPHDAADEHSVKHTKCGEKDKVHEYDLHDEDGQDHVAPCAATGNEDFAGNVHLDTVAEGVKVSIHVTDDDVNEGKLGTDLKPG
jgi:hypothetical protein